MADAVIRSSENNTAAAISKLHADILWRIFMINADMEDGLLWWFCQISRRTFFMQFFQDDLVDHPLIIARRTSQVCRRWREIMLASPSLWGSLIDLELLRQPSDYWRMEVLKRAGSSPLEIRGTIYKESENLKTFFYSLFTDHWERIRRLEVRLQFPLELVPDSIWKTINLPAPNMEAFCFDSDSFARLPPVKRLNGANRMKLFANNAPSLVEFCASSLSYNPSAPWMPQLRRLILASPFSLQDLFLTLANTPLLEFLSLEQEISDRFAAVDTGHLPDSKTIKKISLPYLLSMFLRGKFLPCLSIFDTIIPSSHCSLNLRVAEADGISHEEGNTFMGALMRYTEFYRTVPGMTHLKLQIQPDSLWLTFNETSDFNLFVQVSTRRERWLDLYSSLLDLVSTLRLANVANFTFLLFPNLDHRDRPGVNSLLSALSGVETLTATRRVLSNKILKQEPVVFPSLHTLTLSALGGLDILDEPFKSPSQDQMGLLSLLKWRKEIGKPVRVLDLTERRIGNWGNLGYLEEMRGLKVKWRNQGLQIEEYVCGSGTPKRLDLRINESLSKMRAEFCDRVLGRR